VGFFDRFPPPDRPEPEPARAMPRWAKPDTTLGGTVATEETILGRGDAAVVGLSGLTAYPNGFAFLLTVILREEDHRGRVFHLGFHRDFVDDEPPAPEFLRVGVQYADGTTATNLGGYPGPLEEGAEDPLLLLQDGGGGGGRRYEQGYWVWPLPPPGPVTFVCEWPAYGIAESQTEVDAQLIRDAAARAVTIWPDPAAG
jgi:hypothetical protein